MAVYEKNTLLRCKDENENEHLLYPITKLDCVDGAEDLVHYDKDQELTAVQKAQFLKNIGGLCAPVSAQANQFLKVSAVDANGNVTAVETAEGSTEGPAVDIYTQADEPVDVEDGSVWFNTGNADGTISILVRRNGSWEISSDGVAQVQPDWEQTDASNPGYVRNKPFGYTTDLYANSTLPFAAYQNNIYSANLSDSLASSINAGDHVTIVWDSVQYELTAKTVRLNEYITVHNALGNGKIGSEAWGTNLNIDTGEPFLIIPALEVVYTRSHTTTHSLIIKDNETIVKIDTKFLPDEALYTPVQSDWNETDENSSAFIANKPDLTGYATEDYVQNEISKIDVGGGDTSFEQVQADWDETDETSPAYIKNKPTISGDGNVSTQANWSQTDATQPDFIKNKPFGEEKAEILLPETTCEFFENEMFGCAYDMYPAPFNITIGETYRVRWNDIDYNCVAQDMSSFADGAIGLGDLTSLDGTGNNEPFMIGISESYGAIFVSLEFKFTNTIGMYKGDDIITKIDPKFIPIPYFGEENTTETLLEETTYSFAASSALGCYANTITVMPFTFADGQTYKIVWDSEKYTRTAFSFTHADGSTCVAVGNPLAAGGESNDDKFAIICDMTHNYVHFCSLETLDSHKVAVYQEITTVTKIDSKYLPDNIGGGSALPEVTTSDAGKFLRVSSLGTWAVESIPNAEEASF